MMQTALGTFQPHTPREGYVRFRGKHVLDLTPAELRDALQDALLRVAELEGRDDDFKRKIRSSF